MKRHPIFTALVAVTTLLPVLACAQAWAIQRQKPDGTWSAPMKHSGVVAARQQVTAFCDPEMAARLKWTPPVAVRVITLPAFTSDPKASTQFVDASCQSVAGNQQFVADLLPAPVPEPSKTKETVKLWD